MNREETGALIAAARKERNLTQRELARMLHVSDRAVSKWERGAGFPDVSLLEPLAEALELNVLDLLRGETTPPAEPEMTVRRAVDLLLRQTREKTRRRWNQLLGGALALILTGFVVFGILDYAGVFLRPVSLTMPATVYVNGKAAGETTVTIEGTREILGRKTYEGSFAIDCVEETCRENVMAYLCWDALEEGGETLRYHGFGPGISAFPDTGVDPWIYITEEMQSFGLRLENGTIIATDAFYVPLLEADYYYSIRPVVLCR